MNTLNYGDNLKILLDYIKDESVIQAPLLPETGVPAAASASGVEVEGGHRFGDGVVGVAPFNSNP